MSNIFEFLDNNALNYQMVGSKAIPTSESTNDTDYVVLVSSYSPICNELLNMEWEQGGSFKTTNRQSYFYSFRKGDLNLILTDNQSFYDHFVLATRMCILLETKTREERILVHECFRKAAGFSK